MTLTLTSPWMTPELEIFRDTVRRFVASEVVPHQQRWREQQHVDRALWRKAGELGLLLAVVPED
jgi:acyl-CoA dehydrogenase